MLLPALGLLLSVTFFGSTGALVLWLAGVRPLRVSVLTTFVLAAQVGMLAFGVVYGRVFANADYKLTSGAAVVGMLLGLPLAGILCGWLAARWFSARARAAASSE